MPNPIPAPERRPPAVFSFSLRDAAYLFFRFRERVAGFAVAVMAAAVIGVTLLPPVYESDAKILLRRGRETLALDPTVDATKMIPVYSELMNDINSEIAILKSRELAEQVVRDVGVDKLVNAATPAQSDALGAAATALAASLKIQAEEKSYIITIQYANRDPELAQQVVAKLIERYMAKHVAIFQTSGAFELFKLQSDELLKNLEKTEADMRNFKNLFGIASLDEQQKIVANRIRSIQQQMESVKTSLAASEARVQTLTRIQTGTATPDTARPLMIAGEDYRRIQSDLLQEQTSISAMRAQTAELDAFMADAQAELKRLNESEHRLDEMKREKSLVEARYLKYADNLEQARINRTLETAQLSNIRIVQPASRPANPKPKHTAVRLVAALLFALVGGFGVALVSDFLDHTFTRPEDVERVLGVPTLVSIPRLTDLAGEPAGPLGAPGDGPSRPVRKAWRIPDEVADTFDVLRHRVLQALKPESDAPVVLGVTSTHFGEGTTFVATNLAVTLARYMEDSQILYVDASRYLQTRRDPNAKELSAAEFRAAETGEVSVVERNLYTIPPTDAAKDARMPATVAARDHERLVPLIRRRGYRFVIVDIPPLNEGTAPLRLGGPLDGVLLVIESGKVRWEAAQWGIELLRDANANVLGVALNKRRFYIPQWLYRRL